MNSARKLTFFTVSINPLDLNCKPKSPLNCETAMITEVAEVKPTVTGTDMKSIRTPVLKIVKKNKHTTNKSALLSH